MAIVYSVVEVGAAPIQTVVNGVETLSLDVQIPLKEPIPLQLRSRITGSSAELLRKQQPSSRLFITGVITLEKVEKQDLAVVDVSVVAIAPPEMFLNEVIVVGNFGKAATVSDSGKSVRRSMAIDKLVRNNGKTEKATDWFTVRAYKGKEEKETSLMNRLEQAPNGSTIEITGVLTPRSNQEKTNTWVEVHARSLKVHKRNNGKPTPVPVEAAASVGGYDDEDFHQNDDVPMDW